MTPKFVRAVDPIFQSALNFLERLEQPKRLVLSDERARIQKKFDQAEAMLGNLPNTLWFVG
jgi:type VI secretion system protein ImpK